MALQVLLHFLIHNRLDTLADPFSKVMSFLKLYD